MDGKNRMRSGFEDMSWKRETHRQARKIGLQVKDSQIGNEIVEVKVLLTLHCKVVPD
jgi:hypothetical protein